MRIGRIHGATRTFGPPKGVGQDDCQNLAIRDEPTDMGNCMVSAWYPTPDEAKRILSGEPIYLYVFGTIHPMVAMGVPECGSTGG